MRRTSRRSWTHRFYGVVYTTRAAMPVMRKQKSGHIFFRCLRKVEPPTRYPGNTPYHAAKWAVGGFSDSLAMEVAPFGVKRLHTGAGRYSDQLGTAGRSAMRWTCCRSMRPRGRFVPEDVGEDSKGVGKSDPRKIADVILQLANSDEVPVRLILGVDAEKRVQQGRKLRAAAEAEKWRQLTVSTVFEDGLFDSRLNMAVKRLKWFGQLSVVTAARLLILFSLQGCLRLLPPTLLAPQVHLRTVNQS